MCGADLSDLEEPERDEQEKPKNESKPTESRENGKDLPIPSH